MPAHKGYGSVAAMQRRKSSAYMAVAKMEPEAFDRSGPEALAVCRDDYLLAMRMKNYSERTVGTRQEDLRGFLHWAADRDLTQSPQVTRLHLESYRQWLWRYRKANEQPLGWGTQRRRLSALKDWFRWLTRQNRLLHNPASELELPQGETRLPPTALTSEQMEKLFARCDLNDPLGVRDRTILEVFYATGIRRAELCALACTAVNHARGTLTIRRGKGAKDRVVPLGQRALAWINRYNLEVRPKLLVDTNEPTLFLTGFGEGFSANAMSRMIAQFLEAVGVVGSCHLLRHTCATHMLEHGADVRYVQQLLGHESIETTALYTQVTISQLLEVHARCHPSARGGVAASSG